MDKFELKDLVIDVTVLSKTGKAKRVAGIMACCDGPCTCYGSGCTVSDCSGCTVTTTCNCFQEALGLEKTEARKTYAKLEKKLAEIMGLMKAAKARRPVRRKKPR